MGSGRITKWKITTMFAENRNQNANYLINGEQKHI